MASPRPAQTSISALLEPPDVGDDVDRVGQPHDRVADQLTGAVPGDLAAAVDVDDRRAVERPLVRLGALAGRVDRRVLQQQQRVGRLAGDPGGVQLALPRPRLLVGDKAGAHDPQFAHAPSLSRRSGEPPRLQPGLDDGAVRAAFDPVGGGVGTVGHDLDQFGAAVDQPDAVVGGVPVGQRAVGDQPVVQRAALLLGVVVDAVGRRDEGRGRW